jgi:hypothetical protein
MSSASKMTGSAQHELDCGKILKKIMAEIIAWNVILVSNMAIMLMDL